MLSYNASNYEHQLVYNRCLLEFALSCVHHGVQKGYLVWGYFMSEINGGETFVEMDNEVVQAQCSMCPYHEYIINEP